MSEMRGAKCEDRGPKVSEEKHLILLTQVSTGILNRSMNIKHYQNVSLTLKGDVLLVLSKKIKIKNEVINFSFSLFQESSRREHQYCIIKCDENCPSTALY